eukprot:364714-Chlamydomonas_euryale.AAC.3
MLPPSSKKRKDMVMSPPGWSSLPTWLKNTSGPPPSLPAFDTRQPGSLPRGSPVLKHAAAARAGAAARRVRLLHVPDHRAAGVEHVHDEVLLKARGAAAVVVAAAAAGVSAQAVLVHQRSAWLVERQHVVGRGAAAARLEAPTCGATVVCSVAKASIVGGPRCPRCIVPARSAPLHSCMAGTCLQRSLAFMHGWGLPAALLSIHAWLGLARSAIKHSCMARA